MSRSEKDTTGILSSTNASSSISNKRKKIFLSIFASFLIVSTIIGVVVGVKSSKNNSQNANIELSTAHVILKSSCESTLYPDLCYSALANSPIIKKVTSQKDVIEVSLNITIAVVQKNYFVIEKILKKKKLTKREKGALHDCLESIDETLDELHKAVEDLEFYPNKKTLKQHADDLKTLLSAAMTNPETCIDGFSHDGADNDVRQALLAGQEHIGKMCSNALAMICNMTNTDIINLEKVLGRKLKAVGSSEWPEWLSGGDRRLLQSSTITPNVVVAADGSGNFKTVAEAVAKAPEKSSKRYVIRIKSGVYRENVEVPKGKTNIMFLGDGRSKTIITGSKNVVDGSTTFNSATVGKLLLSFILI
ncbi:esterase [Lithospermum erythrorhizon]|uniref:Pectinesterase n=1 Tax=Lithospermum erythrorhizon TaxID=34254 RepID=A0AAV3QZU9_LITER